MEQYRLLDKLGDGTYGTVFRASHNKTNEIVAIKKFKEKYSSWDDCMQLKEIKALRKLNHPNIIKLKEVLKVQDELNLVFEFLDKNILQTYMEYKNSGRPMEEYRIRSIIKQCIEGLAYMHKHGYFHRDLKPENLLLSGDTLKICDFGLAREVRSRPPFTDYVATRWYRAPEILLKQPNYNSPVDIFAIGCIMAELYMLTPLFSGSSQIDQLNKICKVLGTPNHNIWPEGIRLASQLGITFPQCQPQSLEKIIPNCSSQAIQLLNDMLKFDPSKRPSAQQILDYPYFQNELPQNVKLKKKNSIREEYKHDVFQEASKQIFPEFKELPPVRNKMQDTSQQFLDLIDQKIAENDRHDKQPLRQRDKKTTKVKEESVDREIQLLLEEEKQMKRSNPFRLMKQNDQQSNGFYQQQSSNPQQNDKKNHDDFYDRELASLLEEDKQMKKTNQFRYQKQAEPSFQINNNLQSYSHEPLRNHKPINLVQSNLLPYNQKLQLLPKMENQSNIYQNYRRNDPPPQNYSDFTNLMLPPIQLSIQGQSKLPLYYQSKIQQNYGQKNNKLGRF